MQIAQARKQASKFLEQKMIRSMARRPDPNGRVMARHQGKLILAGSEDELQEKLAKRIQAQARSRLN